MNLPVTRWSRCMWLMIMFQLIHQTILAQVDGDFAFGNIRLDDFKEKRYDKDSSAHAVVLDEFGKAKVVINNKIEVVFYHHVRIKILTNDGQNKANIRVPLYKSGERYESIADIQASTFNAGATAVKQTKLDPAGIINENTSKYLSYAKFTLPEVKAGSIIEYSYQTYSPFYYRLHRWEFQSDIPKIHTEYWTVVPRELTYNTSLYGYYPLQKNEHEETFESEVNLGGARTFTLRSKYAMAFVPPFIEEKYMTAEKNFLSAIAFELKTINLPEYTKSYTKDWDAVDDDLKTDDEFGMQLRKDRNNFWAGKLVSVLKADRDSLQTAKSIFYYIKKTIAWDNHHGIYTHKGIKTAFEGGMGNIADINLSLVSALRYAGIQADPVLLSTRDNGVISTIHPVITDFNYVITRCVIGTQVYFLDATQKELPFGAVSMACLNGRGRIINQAFHSDWVEIPVPKKTKYVSSNTMVLAAAGNFKRTLTEVYYGYEAYSKRNELDGYNTTKEFIDWLNNQNHTDQIKQVQIKNQTDAEQPLAITIESERKLPFEESEAFLSIGPFFYNPFTENPLKAPVRLYPVDFAYPQDWQFSTVISLPENYKISSLPEKQAINLAGNSCKFLYNVELKNEKQVVVTVRISINKTVYTSAEYASLREFFSRVVKSMNEEVVIERMK